LRKGAVMVPEWLGAQSRTILATQSLLLSALALLSGCSTPKAVVVEQCVIAPSPVVVKHEVDLKAALEAVKRSGNVDVTYKSEASKLFDINQDLVRLYALSTYCLMSKNLTEPQKDALRDRINSITLE